jgi:hypothetical protein
MPAPGSAEVAGQGHQGQGRADAGAAVAVALRRDAHAHGGGALPAQQLRELFDQRGVDATQLRCALQGEVPRRGQEGVRADRVRFDKGVVQAAGGRQQVRDSIGEHHVRARQQRDMQIRVARDARALRIDHHQPCTVLLCPADEGGGVQVARGDVVAPDDDQPRCGEFLEIDAPGIAEQGVPGSTGGAGAERRGIHARGPEAVEESLVHAAAGEQAHGSAVGQGGDGLRSPALDDRAEARVDQVQGLFPADRLEVAAGDGRAPAHRLADAQCAVHLCRKAVHHLGAELAAGVGIALAATHRGDALAVARILHDHLEAAGIGTVQGAHAVTPFAPRRRCGLVVLHGCPILRASSARSGAAGVRAFAHGSYWRGRGLSAIIAAGCMGGDRHEIRR